MNQCIHILNGDSAAGSLLQALVAKRSEMLVFRDVLSCGPLYPFKNLNQWRQQRLSYWKHLSQENGSEINVDDTKQSDFYDQFLNLDSSTRFQLWLGMALSDQLLLCFVVFLFEQLNIDLKKLIVVQFSGYWNQKFKLPITGLGLLRPNEITQHPKPKPLTEKQQRYALTAWQAFSSYKTEDYLQFMEVKDKPLPLLYQAMTLVKLRYPNISNGMTAWDQLLLENTHNHGPQAHQIIGNTIADNTLVLDTVGDWYLYNRLIKLADTELNIPLLTMSTTDMQMRSTNFQLTDFGRQVLSHQANNLRGNGIDDWIGGVHLTSADGELCCRNEKQQLISLDLTE